MGSLTLAAIVFAVVFLGGAIGLELQRRLPESFTTGGPRDMTGAVVGLMTLLLALVLGLLIWTAYGVFSTQKTSIGSCATPSPKGRYLARSCVRSCRLPARRVRLRFRPKT
jgi:hypothetical protein